MLCRGNCKGVVVHFPARLCVCVCVRVRACACVRVVFCVCVVCVFLYVSVVTQTRELLERNFETILLAPDVGLCGPFKAPFSRL